MFFRIQLLPLSIRELIVASLSPVIVLVPEGCIDPRIFFHCRVWATGKRRVFFLSLPFLLAPFFLGKGVFLRITYDLFCLQDLLFVGAHGFFFFSVCSFSSVTWAGEGFGSLNGSLSFSFPRWGKTELDLFPP